MIEITECKACGNKASESFIEKDEFKLVRCSSCGFVYLNPRPTRQYLHRLYESKFYNQEGGPRQIYEDFLKHPRYYTIINKLSKVRFIKKYGKGRRLLDVGCACGIFLNAAKKEGYDVEGIEISEDAVTTAKEKFGLNVFASSFQGNTLGSSNFDIITMWDVLEHSSDPLADLTEAHRLLNPKGLLAIQAPNLRGLDARILGKDWGWLQVPYHLYFFTPATLKKMVEKANFAVLAVRTYHLDLWDILLRKFFKRYDKNGKAGIIRFYDKEKGRKLFYLHFLILGKHFLYIIVFILKCLIYPLVILAKRGSLIQLYAEKK